MRNNLYLERAEVGSFASEVADDVGVAQGGDVNVGYDTATGLAVGKGPAFATLGGAYGFADEIEAGLGGFDAHGGPQAARC